MKIITDSSSDIDVNLAKDLDVTVLPLRVTFDDGTYAPYTEMSNDEFYNKMNSKSDLPSTSLASPGEIEDAAKPFLDKGEEVICILMSSKLSGTYQSSIVAQSNLDDKNFYTFDSLTGSAAQKLLVLQAVEMRKNGKTAGEIITELERMRSKVVIMLGVTELKNLYKGGRLSKSQAFIGGVLNIKPIVWVNSDGAVAALGKERGSTKLYGFFCDRINEKSIDKNHKLYVIHAQALNEANELIKILKANCSQLKDLTIDISELGPTIGTHSGSGCVGIAFATV